MTTDMPTSGRINARSRPFRRGLRRAAAAVFGVVLAGSVLPGLAGAQDDFIAGSGNAYAQVYRVGPTAARLSLAPILGLSLADYLNTVGRGQVKAAEWAAVGVAEPALPENTPELQVESTDPGAEKGKTEYVAGQADDSGNGGGLMELFARATKAPLGESSFKLERFAIPGLIDVGGGVAHTSAGIVGGKLREARAEVDISGLAFAGTVALSGLHWEAVQRTSNGRKTVTGSFTIQRASIGGVPLPVPSGDISTVLGPVNTALAPTGFAIKAPGIDRSGGVASVSPLAIEIVNSPLGRQFLAPILEAAQPIREPLTDAIISGSGGEASVAILVADLTLGIFSGSSQLHMELGGVHAFTEGERYANPFGPGGFRPPPAPPQSQSVFVPGTVGRPPVPGAPGDSGELVAALPAGPGQRTIPGGRGGLAVAVGLVGLLVAGALATRDYWKMRKIHRAEFST